MVFRKRKFGIRTGRTMKRQLRNCTDQFTVTKQAGHSSNGGFSVYQENEIKSSLKLNQFEDYDGELQSGNRVVYSLNKHKRWMLPILLREHISNEHESCKDKVTTELILVERHLHPVTAGRKADCIGACRSTLADAVSKTPSKKQKYSCSRDLLRSAKPTQPELIELLTVYDVSYMPSCNSYPHFYENKHHYFEKDRIYSFKKYSKSFSLKNDIKKYEGVSATDVVTNESNIIALFSDENQEEKDADQTKRNIFTLGDFCLSLQRPYNCKNKSKLRRRKLSTNDFLSPKTVKYIDTSEFFIDDIEEISTDTVENTICKPSMVENSKKLLQHENHVSSIELFISTETVRYDRLLTKYGSSLKYSECTPHKFIVDVTSIIHQNLIDRGCKMYADQLNQANHFIYVLFESTTLRKECTTLKYSLHVENRVYRVKLVGLNSPYPVEAHFNKSRIYEVEEVVSLMIHSAATMPPSNFIVNGENI